MKRKHPEEKPVKVFDFTENEKKEQSSSEEDVKGKLMLALDDSLLVNKWLRITLMTFGPEMKLQ